MYNTIKTYGGMEEKQQFLTSAVPGGEWSASRPGHFISGVRVPGTHSREGWVGPRVGQDAVEKIQISYCTR
jgi:hypothetical protein